MSEFIVDKLTGKSSVGNVTITSEGGAATMQLQQGVAKCWARVDQNDSTQHVEDSFNTASVTDGGAGETSVNFTNNMNNSLWCGTCIPGSSNRYVMNNAPNTTRFKIETYAVSTQTANDSTDVYGVVHGDLA